MSMQGIVPEGTPPHWISYLAVDDIDARSAKVVSAGGEIKREPFEVPNVGRIAIVQDASGAVFGLDHAGATGLSCGRNSLSTNR